MRSDDYLQHVRASVLALPLVDQLDIVEAIADEHFEYDGIDDLRKGVTDMRHAIAFGHTPWSPPIPVGVEKPVKRDNNRWAIPVAIWVCIAFWSIAAALLIG